jgi:hypothetical protein
MDDVLQLSVLVVEHQAAHPQPPKVPLHADWLSMTVPPPPPQAPPVYIAYPALP